MTEQKKVIKNVNKDKILCVLPPTKVWILPAEKTCLLFKWLMLMMMMMMPMLSMIGSCIGLIEEAWWDESIIVIIRIYLFSHTCFHVAIAMRCLKCRWVRYIRRRTRVGWSSLVTNDDILLSLCVCVQLVIGSGTQFPVISPYFRCVKIIIIIVGGGIVWVVLRASAVDAIA